MALDNTADIRIREELDVVNLDPAFLERQRNRYASRGVAFVILLNGVAAIALLIALAHGVPSEDRLKPLGDSMVVFGVGATLGLLSIFFAYISRTWRLERLDYTKSRRPLRWLAILAAIAGIACFLGGLNMTRLSVIPNDTSKEPITKPEPEALKPSVLPSQ
jgi:hypothetical protein